MEAVLNQNQFKVKGVLPQYLTISELKELRERKKQEKIEKKQQIKDERIWQSIRNNLIGSMFDEIGVTEEQFNKWNELLKEHAENGNVQTIGDVLNQYNNVANGAVATTRANDRAIIKSAIELTVSILGAAIPGVNFITSLLAVKIAGSAFSLMMASKRRFAGRKNDIADYDQKNEALIEKLKLFIPKVKMFANLIEQSKSEIMEKKKTLSAKEFKSFISKFVQDKIREAGLTELEEAKSDIASKLEEDVSSIESSDKEKSEDQQKQEEEKKQKEREEKEQQEKLEQEEKEKQEQLNKDLQQL